MLRSHYYSQSGVLGTRQIQHFLLFPTADIANLARLKAKSFSLLIPDLVACWMAGQPILKVRTGLQAAKWPPLATNIP